MLQVVGASGSSAAPSTFPGELEVNEPLGSPDSRVFFLELEGVLVLEVEAELAVTGSGALEAFLEGALGCGPEDLPYLAAV